MCPQGAAKIAKKLETLFEENNEKLDFILDEGMFVMKEVFPGKYFSFPVCPRFLEMTEPLVSFRACKKLLKLGLCFLLDNTSATDSLLRLFITN